MEANPLEGCHIGLLRWFVAATQILGLSAVIITGVWLGHYQGGFAWDGSAQQFNVHPLCMVLGMVFLYGDAILVFRTLRNESKTTAKILHASIQLLALVAVIVGTIAVFDFHTAQKIPQMYSLHSWCGLITIILFCLQWVMGLTFFLLPTLSYSLRAIYHPYHVYFGMGLFILAIGTCLAGITEKLLFSISTTYSKYDPQGILANVLGLLLVSFGFVVGYILSRDEWKREASPEEEALSMHFKTLTEGGSPDSQRDQ
ncbi:transmembrane ascorbate-dependent reductase CYB561 [Leucoraja erinacea]|uniref:transmembrane ascorbate-dependent reductase CYB561 n=1 Tax=Leucoraja erinaceus TaxID=7782 RepID=UPI002458F72C|nr:transmembrane ascorbate-dependent reductase CYB561 [Leucoraja erinacea]XP_055513046.1 transmembrane ascorbate-dependent reductase CYB561 [Leucoraja erinacea]XP_055513047.1 transmembrane ascorbate-dependent reductase CYB561 [Leucoraja erinacea]